MSHSRDPGVRRQTGPMTEAQTWTAVDDLITGLLVQPDAALGEALAANDAAGLPAIDVTPALGAMLHVLARSVGARRILEIGTLGGYSTIWLARALPSDGELVTLEVSPLHARVARGNLDRAGVGERVRIEVGPALESLPGLAGPFDLVFVDADKRSNPDYVRWALTLTRPGGLIVVDNVVRNGAVADTEATDPNVVGSRQCLEVLAADPRCTATVVQTVGTKGYDGFALAFVTG